MKGNGLALVTAGPAPALPSGGTITLRHRHVTATAAMFTSTDLEIQSLPDGRSAVILPTELADLFAQDLLNRAEEWQTQLRKAHNDERRRQAERTVQDAERRRLQEATEDRWRTAYDRLRDAGKGHRETLHLLHGNKGRREFPQICEIALSITNSQARQRAREREQRRAEICRLAQEGFATQEISDRTRIPYNTVYVTLKRAGVQPKPGDLRTGVQKVNFGAR
jgi:Homeodomain-like domain